MFNPDAITRYLKWKPTNKPYPVKKMTDTELYELIEDSTGIPFRPKTPPRRHQLASTAFALVEKRAGMFLKMRLGKTKIALDWAEHLRKTGEWKRQGIVVVPSPILIDVWKSEAKKHSDLKVVGARLTIDDFLDAVSSDADLVVVSWSALQSAFTFRLPKDPNRPRTKALCPDYAAIDELAKFFDLVIFDEIHTCKNSQSLRFSIANRLVMRCVYRIGLTGTPFGRNPFNIWAQAFLLDEGKAFGYNEHFFKSAFGVKNYNPFAKSHNVLSFDKKHRKTFEERLASFSIAYSAQECWTVPLVTGLVELNMLPEQADIYRGVIKKAIEAAKTGLIQTEHSFIRLRQIGSGFLPVEGDEEKSIYHFPSAKFEWLDDFLHQTPPEAKVIICHEFTETGRMICKALAKHKKEFAWLYGGTKDKTAEIAKFVKGGYNFLVMNSASGGVGIDLQVADYQLYFESPVSPITREQSEFRALAPGRNGPLFRDDLICSPTERKILGFIQEGKDLLKLLVYGGVSWKDLL